MAAAAPPADYTFMSKIWVNWMHNHRYPDSHQYLNQYFGDPIEDLDVFFDDGALRTNFKNVVGLSNAFRTAIAEDVVTPATVHPAETNHATAILNVASFYVGTEGGRL